MKITIVVDKLGSAIHNLALPIQKHNSHLDIQICDLHPKRPSEVQMRRVLKEVDDSDLIDIHYWKSAKLIEDALKGKKKILFHFNPYDLDKEDWNEYNQVVVGNEEMNNKLPKSVLIPYTVDLDFFTFNIDDEKYATNKDVLMVVARIESSKGVLEVAQACKDLGYKFTLVGSISDGAYFEQIKALEDDIFKVNFLNNISKESLRDTYYNSAVLVCNSKDNFESGTLPILEAMACGIPVLTRIVGHVPELYDGDNMMINEGEKENVEKLKEKLKELMEDVNLRQKYRTNGFSPIKNRNDKTMATRICKLYYKIIGHPFVSIIIPTFDKPDVLKETLQCAVNQTYPYKEIIIIDSGNESAFDTVRDIKTISKVPIKYIRFENKGEYTLPKARNIGVMNALGDYLVFCDERINMNADAVEQFIQHVSFKTWLYGIKNDYEKGFVENFSCIARNDLIMIGMFNERIDCYGGGSQEIRTRFGLNGFMFEFVPLAKAYAKVKSGARYRKKNEIIDAKYKLYQLYE